MRKKIAIVGLEERTRHLAPFDDPDFDILVFNETPTDDWCKRWDMLLEIHVPSVYKNLNNPRHKDHWAWLKQSHGKPIYMQKVDPEVPDSVAYPVQEILDEYMSTLTYEGRRQQYIRATVCYAVALALYLGYEEIHIWGVELLDYAEYRSQQNNFAFWVGIATSRKVPVTLHCCKGMFSQPLYGYEEFMQEDKLQRYLEGITQQLEEEKIVLAKLEGAKMMLTQMLMEQKVVDNVEEVQQVQQ